MDSALRPRDIQARIRAGETPEEVADAARTTVEKIMPFVGPVLAEREHVAERAQRATLRRRAGESGPGRLLGDAVETHLRAANVDPALVDWDAWRREDGRWVLSGAFRAGGRSGVAHLVYDAPGNYVVLDDDDARWLVGDAVAEPEPSRDDLATVRGRRLGTVPAPARPDGLSPAGAQEELPLGDDAIELVNGSPVDAWLDTSPASDDPARREDAADAAAEDVDPEPPASEREPEVDAPDAGPASEPTRRPVQKKKGRASVPSWDEIMFGGGDT